MDHCKWLLKRCGPHQNAVPYLELVGDRVTIGRANFAAINVPSYVVSRLHATFKYQNGGWTVTDESSVNGVHVYGGVKIEAKQDHPLREGDRIGFGVPVTMVADPHCYVYELSRVKIDVNDSADDEPDEDLNAVQLTGECRVTLVKCDSKRFVLPSCVRWRRRDNRSTSSVTAQNTVSPTSSSSEEDNYAPVCQRMRRQKVSVFRQRLVDLVTSGSESDNDFPVLLSSSSNLPAKERVDPQPSTSMLTGSAASTSRKQCHASKSSPNRDDVKRERSCELDEPRMSISSRLSEAPLQTLTRPHTSIVNADQLPHKNLNAIGETLAASSHPTNSREGNERRKRQSSSKKRADKNSAPQLASVLDENARSSSRVVTSDSENECDNVSVPPKRKLPPSAHNNHLAKKSANRHSHQSPEKGDHEEDEFSPVRPVANKKIFVISSDSENESNDVPAEASVLKLHKLPIAKHDEQHVERPCSGQRQRLRTANNKHSLDVEHKALDKKSTFDAIPSTLSRCESALPDEKKKWTGAAVSASKMAGTSKMSELGESSKCKSEVAADVSVKRVSCELDAQCATTTTKPLTSFPAVDKRSDLKSKSKLASVDDCSKQVPVITCDAPLSSNKTNVETPKPNVVPDISKIFEAGDEFNFVYCLSSDDDDDEKQNGDVVSDKAAGTAKAVNNDGGQKPADKPVIEQILAAKSKSDLLVPAKHSRSVEAKKSQNVVNELQTSCQELPSSTSFTSDIESRADLSHHKQTMGDIQVHTVASTKKQLPEVEKSAATNSATNGGKQKDIIGSKLGTGDKRIVPGQAVPTPPTSSASTTDFHSKSKSSRVGAPPLASSSAQVLSSGVPAGEPFKSGRNVRVTQKIAASKSAASEKWISSIRGKFSSAVPSKESTIGQQQLAEDNKLESESILNEPTPLPVNSEPQCREVSSVQSSTSNEPSKDRPQLIDDSPEEQSNLPNKSPSSNATGTAKSTSGVLPTLRPPALDIDIEFSSPQRLQIDLVPASDDERAEGCDDDADLFKIDERSSGSDIDVNDIDSDPPSPRPSQQTFSYSQEDEVVIISSDDDDDFNDNAASSAPIRDIAVKIENVDGDQDISEQEWNSALLGGDHRSHSIGDAPVAEPVTNACNAVHAAQIVRPDESSPVPVPVAAAAAEPISRITTSPASLPQSPDSIDRNMQAIFGDESSPLPARRIPSPIEPLPSPFAALLSKIQAMTGETSSGQRISSGEKQSPALAIHCEPVSNDGTTDPNLPLTSSIERNLPSTAVKLPEQASIVATPRSSLMPPGVDRGQLKKVRFQANQPEVRDEDEAEPSGGGVSPNIGGETGDESFFPELSQSFYEGMPQSQEDDEDNNMDTDSNVFEDWDGNDTDHTAAATASTSGRPGTSYDNNGMPGTSFYSRKNSAESSSRGATVTRVHDRLKQASNCNQLPNYTDPQNMVRGRRGRLVSTAQPRTVIAPPASAKSRNNPIQVVKPMSVASTKKSATKEKLIQQLKNRVPIPGAGCGDKGWADRKKTKDAAGSVYAGPAQTSSVFAHSPRTRGPPPQPLYDPPVEPSPKKQPAVKQKVATSRSDMLADSIKVAPAPAVSRLKSAEKRKAIPCEALPVSKKPRQDPRLNRPAKSGELDVDTAGGAAVTAGSLSGSSVVKDGQVAGPSSGTLTAVQPRKLSFGDINKDKRALTPAQRRQMGLPIAENSSAVPPPRNPDHFGAGDRSTANGPAIYVHHPTLQSDEVAAATDKVVFHILNWKVNWLVEQSGCTEIPPILITPGAANENFVLHPLRDTYRDHQHYVNTFQSLLYHELWTEISKDNKYSRSRLKLQVIKVTPLAPAADISFERYECYGAVLNTDMHLKKYLQDGYLVSVDIPVIEKGKSNTAVKLFALVESCQRMSTVWVQQNWKTMPQLRNLPQKDISNWTVLMFSLKTKYKLPQVNKAKLLDMRLLTYIRPKLRMFQILHYLPLSSFSKKLFNPDVNICKLPVIQSFENMVRIPDITYNTVQKQAIMRTAEACISASSEPKVCLIQGPPGTGKSTVVVGLVYQLVSGNHNKKKEVAQPLILLCAPSNAAVDDLVLKLSKFKKTFAKHHPACAEIRIVRAGQNAVSNPETKRYGLDELIEQNRSQADGEITKVKIQIERYDSIININRESLNKAAEKMSTNHDEAIQECDSIGKTILSLNKQRQDAVDRIEYLKQHSHGGDSGSYYRVRTQVLLKSDVICTTLGGCTTMGFDAVLKDAVQRSIICIIDEASQAIEPECLLPLQFGINKLVLVGDHQQLQPTVTSKVCGEMQLGRSLFERLQRQPHLAVASIMLQRQYRMLPDLSLFPSKTFYDGKLENVKETERHFAQYPFRPYLLLNVKDSEEQQINDGYANRKEASFVVRLCEVINSKNADVSIGIITFYKEQKILLNKEISQSKILKQAGGNYVEVNTVDGFQGREKDVIVVSAVRANNKKSIGFLGDRRRLNVAITRGRCGLYVCGHLPTLTTKDGSGRLWSRLIENATARSCAINVNSRFDGKTIEEVLRKT